MIIKNNEIKIEQYKNIRELLINIDMINGFVKEGNLAAPSIMRVVPRQEELLIENEKNEYGANLFIRDEHNENAMEFKNYGKHCIRGTKEELVIPEFDTLYKNAIDIPKNNTNFMFAPDVIKLFENLPNLKKVKLMGCLSEVCVKNGAIGARCYFDEVNRNVEVGVYEDAIDTFDAPGHNRDIVTKNALKDMEANGVKIYRKVR